MYEFNEGLFFSLSKFFFISVLLLLFKFIWLYRNVFYFTDWNCFRGIGAIKDIDKEGIS